MAEIHFYDFDGTLFRSPHEPSVWEGGWWDNPESLVPPCVPDHPGTEWWIAPTVSAARKSISNSDVYAVVATGRPLSSGLRIRIPELLKQQGLRFDEVHLAPPSGTLAWKKRLLGNLIGQFPFVTGVRIWDDRKFHLAELVKVSQAMGVPPESVDPNWVRAKAMEPECDLPGVLTTPSKKATYIGLFLDSKSRGTLMHEFPPIHDKVWYDHITLVFKPSPTSNLWAWVGDKVQAKVIGYAEDEKGQTVTVEILGGLLPEKENLHVTLSVTPGTESVYSSELIRTGLVERVDGPLLSGVVDSFPRSIVPSPSRVAGLHKLSR